MRLCSGHPRVHFRNRVEGSWEGGGGGGGCTVGPPGSLTNLLSHKDRRDESALQCRIVLYIMSSPRAAPVS